MGMPDITLKAAAGLERMGDTLPVGMRRLMRLVAAER